MEPANRSIFGAPLLSGLRTSLACYRQGLAGHEVDTMYLCSFLLGKMNLMVVNMGPIRGEGGRKMSKSLILVISLLVILLCGCSSRIIRPIYVPRGVFYEDFTGMPVRLLVHDDRKKEGRIFYRLNRHVFRESSQPQERMLEPSSCEIVERSVRKAMESSGYLLEENAAVVIDVAVRDFIWIVHTEYMVGFARVLTADIELEVSVVQSGKIILKKTIAETVERDPTPSNINAEEKMFNECLRTVVEKLVSDYNIVTAIKKCYRSSDENTDYQSLSLYQRGTSQYRQDS